MKRPRAPQKSGLPARKRPARSADRAAPGQTPDEIGSGATRLQKFMARAGVGSRRHCEELITTGRVEIDGRTVTELGTKVLPGQQVAVDGTSLTHARAVYYLVNKPAGVVSTNDDPAGRTRVVDLLPPVNERLFTVGRLDMSSEGLILVTNDGELANRLAHPRYGVEKTYQVVVAGTPDAEVLETLRRGVHLAEGLARATSVRVKKSLKQSTLLEIVLSEGKNREIRRILAKVGHKVLRLRRTAIGPLRLGDMEPGEFRRLSGEELRELRGQRTGKSATRKRAVAHARPHLRPGGVRSESGDAAPPATKPGGAKHRAARPAAGGTAGSRQGGARPTGTRSIGPRPGGASPAGAKPTGARSGGAKPPFVKKASPPAPAGRAGTVIMPEDYVPTVPEVRPAPSAPEQQRSGRPPRERGKGRPPHERATRPAKEYSDSSTPTKSRRGLGTMVRRKRKGRRD